MPGQKTLTDDQIKSAVAIVRDPKPAIARLAELIAKAEKSGKDAVRIPLDAARDLTLVLKYVGATTNPNDGTDFKAADLGSGSDLTDMPSGDW